MKLATLLFSFVCVVILSSSMSLSRMTAAIGSQAPDFAVYNSETSVRPADLIGKQVIINFWSSTDAVSRERNSRLAREAAASGKEFIGICVDKDRTLMQEILHIDGLETANQYMAGDMRKGNAIKSYQTENGLRAFEVDPYGNIERIWE